MMESRRPHGEWRIRRDTGWVSDRPRVLAIINASPDSFYAKFGGANEDALDVALAAIDEGADGLDVGGESTQPGAKRVSPEDQCRRILPVIEALRRRGGTAGSIPISVDTTRASVARAAMDAGADAINDVAAGREDGDILALAAERTAGLILMHRLTVPERDSYSDRYTTPPAYGDVVREVREFLGVRLRAAVDAGVAPEAILLDPGLGFGKTVEQNVALVRRTAELLDLGRPLLSAASRKSFVGRVGLGRDSDPGERLAGTIAFGVAHWAAGASVFRVHDVAEHVQALRIAAAVFPRAGGGAPAPAL